MTGLRGTILALWAAWVALAVGVGGCTTAPPGGDADDVVASDSVTPGDATPVTPVAAAEQLVKTGDFAGVLALCSRLSGTPADTPELRVLRDRAALAINEQRTTDALRRDELAMQRMAVEAVEKNDLPDTYELRRMLEPRTNDVDAARGELERSLATPVTVHLKGADLSAVIAALSTDANLNVIADKDLGKGKQIDIECDNVPLRELLDYIERNFGVRLYVGHNLIWATANDSGNAPLETRVFHLKKGVQFHGSDWGPAAATTAAATRPSISFRATELPSTKTYLEEIISEFTSEVKGAKLVFDRNTHALFARNTPENLATIAEIVKALDVNPPQVLIEARFIEITVADLRELGLEWALQAPVPITKTTVTTDTGTERLAKTQIADGNLVSYSPYTSDGAGEFPLGPRGVFGQTRDGNPSTADQGLNLTYQGILTQPMFEAVLHALEISGKGRTLSVPRVTTLNNNPAKLRHGEDLRFYEEFQAQAFSLLDDSNRKYTITVLIPSGKPSIEELGITLVAVPSVGADMRTISLLLTPTISQLESFVSYQDDALDKASEDSVRQVVVKLPIISRREIQTKVIVESGETVVMGGLIDVVEQDTVHKVPLLGDLPGIGHLFQRKDVTEQRKNLLVFVTATVLSERGESLITREALGTLPGVAPARPKGVVTDATDAPPAGAEPRP